jgi:hypothetical protein
MAAKTLALMEDVQGRLGNLERNMRMAQSTAAPPMISPSIARSSIDRQEMPESAVRRLGNIAKWCLKIDCTVQSRGQHSNTTSNWYAGEVKEIRELYKEHGKETAAWLSALWAETRPPAGKGDVRF